MACLLPATLLAQPPGGGGGRGGGPGGRGGSPLAGPAAPAAAQSAPIQAPTRALAAAIQEFRVQTANLTGSATAGAGRGGANRPAAKPAWHGRVYENLRNNAFDANPHQIVQRGGEPRQLRRNQYGFSVTGPVVLPKIYNGAGKTFFTMTYEGVKESVGQFSLNTIPTTLERTGSWAHVVDNNGAPLPIYDPLTTALNPLYNSAVAISATNLQYNRQQFVGNIIPVTRLDRKAQEILQQLPQPNTNAGPFFQNNYFAVTPEVNTANGFIISVDHSFWNKHRVTLRLNKSDGLNGNAANFPTLANSQNPNVNVLSRGIRLEHVYTASPTSVNTFRIDLSSQPNKNVAQLDANGKPFPRYQFGATNAFGGGGGGGNNNNNNQQQQQNFQNLQNSGTYTSMGQNNPISRDAQNRFNFGDTFSSRWKSHRFSLDLNANHQQINSFRPQSPEGRFDFTSAYTSLPGIVNTGHPFASFLLGAASQVQQTIVISPSYYRWHNYGAALSDTWQITRSLTLSYGLALTRYAQRTEKYDRQSNISFSETNPVNGLPGALVTANSGKYGRSFIPDWVNWEPNMSLAWSVLGDNNTVLRLSYSRDYGNPNTQNGHFGTQAFNGTELYLSPNTQLTPALILAEGLRPSRFPDLRPEAANGTNAQVWDVSDVKPSSNTFQVRLQRQLAKNLILSATYNLQQGRNQFVNQQLAQPNAIPLENLQYRDRLNTLSFSNSLRPFPQFQDFDPGQTFRLGKNRNRNINVQVEKRTSGGLALTVGYTAFERWDNFSSPVQNVYDRMSAWARAQFSNPHSLNITFLYELPFGPGKPFLSSGFLGRSILGGWAFSGTSTWASGQPLRLQPTFNNTGGVIGVGRLYVDVVPGVDPHVENPGPNQWFNPAAFANPENFTAGNGPRVHPTLLGPGSLNHDATLNKRMALGGDRTLEFTATFLNATNHANWNQPDTRIGSVAAPNFNAGKIVGSTGGRIVQLGLRINF